MSVREAHDIAEGLQQKIERLPEVERVNKTFDVGTIAMNFSVVGFCAC